MGGMGKACFTGVGDMIGPHLQEIRHGRVSNE